jgi:glycosyltransferase involved in cell wall biosynthesis
MAMDHRIEARTHLSDTAEVQFVYPNVGTSPPFAILKLAKQLWRLKPDLLVTYNWGAIEAVVAAKLIGVNRIIHCEYGFGPDEACQQKQRRALSRRLVLKGASFVVVPSTNLERIALQVWKLPREYVVHINNGVDCQTFSPGESRAERTKLGIGITDCVIGTVAHLRREKNLQFLIDAFANLVPDISSHLVIVGDGPEKADLVKQVSRNDIEHRVHFLGHITHPADIYRMMDIFALSSITEQMPLSLLEAMATGLPALSTDVGDVMEMVSVENRRFIVSVADKTSYFEALRALASSRELRLDIGMKNREKVLNKFTHEKMIEAYTALFEEVLGSRRCIIRDSAK